MLTIHCLISVCEKSFQHLRSFASVFECLERLWLLGKRAKIPSVVSVTKGSLKSWFGLSEVRDR